MPGQIVLLAVELHRSNIRGKGDTVIAGRSCDPALHQRCDIDGKKTPFAAYGEGL
jgi:hypothetical protein